MCVRKRPRTWAPSSRTLAAVSRSQLKIREVCFLICRSSAYSEYTLSPIMSNFDWRQLATTYHGRQCGCWCKAKIGCIHDLTLTPRLNPLLAGEEVAELCTLS